MNKFNHWNNAKLKTRFNPFTRYYEVYKFDPLVEEVVVCGEFESYKKAVKCKTNLEHHKRLFDAEREETGMVA